MGVNFLNSIKLTRPKTNRFDLSHDVKMSCKFGGLYPTLAMEVLPGEVVQLGNDSLMRFAPLVAPVMHRVDDNMHYYFVANRLLWPGWEDWISNKKTAGVLPAHPYVNMIPGTAYLGAFPIHTYLGLPEPPAVGETERVSALPFAAYQFIYNEYYRDQNLIAEVPYLLSNGDNTANIQELNQGRLRCWEHDYFTASLPFAQAGDAVAIPLSQFGDVQVFANSLIPIVPGDQIEFPVTGQPGGFPLTEVVPRENADITLGANELFAKTSDLAPNSTNINDLRRAFRVQEWLERAARVGKRYTETIMGFFGVKSPDARLQRPEYIVGTKSPVVISEVLNTSDTATAPQGNMAGHGIAVTNGKLGGYKVMEHGYIIGIKSVMPRTAYQQGIPRHFKKFNDPTDLFWPQFANLGEQEVKNHEVYAHTLTSEGTFGYMARYGEYRILPSRVAGNFMNSLDFWHIGRIFATQPALNEDFVKCDARTDIFAAGATEDYLWCHILHKITAIRPIPKFGTPSM